MNIRTQVKFCRVHKKNSAQNEWIENGYPTIDWNGLDARLTEHHSYIKSEGIIKGMTLETTLFDRLLALHGPAIKRMLTTQYRMHEKIMRFPSDELVVAS
jgi:hypothetical protein